MTVLTCAGFFGCTPKEETEEKPVFNTELYKLSLTEIHYNPSKSEQYPGDSLEFLEIRNTGSVTLDLSELQFTAGVTYAFPEGKTISSGDYYVIASNGTAFKSRYGFDPDGIYFGSLSNSGERIELRDTLFSTIIFAQFYADTGTWAKVADGDGYSLVTINPNPDRTATGPSVWKKSSQRHGSPGAEDVAKAKDPTLFSLRISEIHYNPIDLDGKNGDSLEFVEIKNVGAANCDLSRCMLSGGIDFIFPAGSSLAPDQYVVVASYIPYFKLRYPSITPVGQYSGQLKNSGDKVTLFDMVGDTEIVSIDYKDGSPWPSGPDGNGTSLVAIDPAATADQTSSSAWRSSYATHGSPGADDQGVVIINELLTHTDPPDSDAIELYNPSASPVDIGGWSISDEKVNPGKFKIPAGTIVPAGGYAVFTETQFNYDTTLKYPFTFDSHGDDAWLFSKPVLGCEAYCDHVSFGELENRVSIGRFVNSQGKVQFVAQKDVTLGKANSGPLIGPLVISEILYHSSDNAGDFVEITNIDPANTISLSHPDRASFSWKISGVNFSFPSGVSIKPNESVIVASDSISVDAFRTRYSVPATVQVFQFSGQLSNKSENLKLQKPEDFFVADSTVPSDTTFPYMIFDEVDYSDGGSWPVDVAGQSLQRTAKNAFGNDAANWKSAAQTAGKFE